MAAQKMINSLYFKKWLNYKAVINNIAPLAVGGNVKQYLNAFPVIFNAPYTKQYQTRNIYDGFK